MLALPVEVVALVVGELDCASAYRFVVAIAVDRRFQQVAADIVHTMQTPPQFHSTPVADTDNSYLNIEHASALARYCNAADVCVSEYAWVLVAASIEGYSSLGLRYSSGRGMCVPSSLARLEVVKADLHGVALPATLQRLKMVSCKVNGFRVPPAVTDVELESSEGSVVLPTGLERLVANAGTYSFSYESLDLLRELRLRGARVADVQRLIDSVFAHLAEFEYNVGHLETSISVPTSQPVALESLVVDSLITPSQRLDAPSLHTFEVDFDGAADSRDYLSSKRLKRITLHNEYLKESRDEVPVRELILLYTDDDTAVRVSPITTSLELKQTSMSHVGTFGASLTRLVVDSVATKKFELRSQNLRVVVLENNLVEAEVVLECPQLHSLDMRSLPIEHLRLNCPSLRKVRIANCAWFPLSCLPDAVEELEADIPQGETVSSWTFRGRRLSLSCDHLVDATINANWVKLHCRVTAENIKVSAATVSVTALQSSFTFGESIEVLSISSTSTYNHFAHMTRLKRLKLAHMVLSRIQLPPSLLRLELQHITSAEISFSGPRLQSVSVRDCFEQPPYPGPIDPDWECRLFSKLSFRCPKLVYCDVDYPPGGDDVRRLYSVAKWKKRRILTKKRMVRGLTPSLQQLWVDGVNVLA
ncbi:hypothetical protein DICA4_F08020 [Diutina catenulata]